MAKITRISTTITARYSPASGATDAYWLDGRILGPRETRAADITLDREDKGFLFSTFATQSTGDIKRDLDEVRSILEKTTLEVKHSGKNIDNQITDLAECGIGVAGRVSIQHEGVRQPFFAGIMVKDSEIAAVTMGRGCAYLYRNDTLFPLTKDDSPFEAIDHNGKSVPNIDIYCAGVAGTVRYSNIAQLQVDDCIIVCNREIMDAIGQREMLRILYESIDQSDAAGLVITAAASKLPGTPIQFMIGFVESISTGEKTAKAGGFPMLSKSKSPSDKTDSKLSAMSAITQDDEDYAQDDEIGEDIEDDEDGEIEEQYSTKSKRNAMLAVIAIVIIVCGVVIYSLVTGKFGINTGNVTPAISNSSDESSLVSESSSSLVVSSTITSTTSGVAPTKAAVSSTLPLKHVIASGELLPSIAKKYYNSSDNKYLDAIIAANKAAYPSFTREKYQMGWEITIPIVK